MRAYELMIIFDGDVEDTAVNAQLAAVNALVEAGGGTVAKTERWGRRRFAYEINH
ncbi:MAG: 30S ribosomal protein S6, partial [Acidimicrobiia bacterium]